MPRVQRQKLCSDYDQQGVDVEYGSEPFEGVKDFFTSFIVSWRTRKLI